MQNEESLINDRVGALIGDDFEEEGAGPVEGEQQPAEIERQETDEREVEDGLQEEQEEQEQESDEEAWNVTSLHDLAEHLDVDVADLYNLKIPALQPDGSKREISIGEWKDGWQEAQLVRRDREKYQREAEEHINQLNQRSQVLDASLTQVASILQNAERQLMGEISGLEQLQSTDPTQYVLRKQQLTERKQELDRLKHEALQHYQQNQQQIQQHQEAARSQYLQEQIKRLPDVIPEWKDESIASREKQEIADYLVNSGIPENVVNTLSDALQVSIARKAMLYDKMKKVDTTSKKKVIKIGKKVIKSGSKPSGNAVKVSKINQARSELRKARNTRESNERVASLLENHFLDDMR